MGLTASMIDAMLTSGCTAEQIAAVVKAAIADDAGKTASRRANDAERQRKSRTNRGLSRNVTVTPCDRRDDTPPNDIYSNPPQDTPDDAIASSSPKSKSTRSRVSTGMQPIPDGWEPVLTPAAQRIVDGWPPGWLASKVSEFRDHAIDKGRKSKDWQAAFRNWIIKADGWERQRRQQNERSNQNRSTPDEICDPMVRAIVARQSRQAAGSEPDFDGNAGGWS